MTSGDIAACPKFSLSPAHYRGDGTCRCDEKRQLAKALEDAEVDLRRAQARVALLREQLSTA